MGERRLPGALKAEILQLLWASRSPLTAKQIRGRINASHGSVPSLATVLTVLERLRRSEEVTRSLSDHGEFAYGPCQVEQTQAIDHMLEMLSRSENHAGVLLGFTGNLSESDQEILRRALDDDPRRSDV